MVVGGELGFLASWRLPDAFTTRQIDNVFDWMRTRAIERVPGLARTLFVPGKPPKDVAYRAASEPTKIGLSVLACDEIRTWMWLAAQKGHVEAIQQMVVITQACALSKEFAEQRLTLDNLSSEWLETLGRLTDSGQGTKSMADKQSSTLAPAVEDVEELEEIGFGTTVITKIGDQESREGGEISKRYRALIGRKLPFLGELPEPRRIGDAIRQRWPWAEIAAERIENRFAVLRAAEGDRPITLSPMLFVGPPGSGKSTLARFVCEATGLPTTVLPLGGVADGAGISAVTRSWATTRPSAIVLGMHEHNCANPAFVLEEIDKTSRSTSANGSAADALLQLIGSGTYHDLCLMAPVDISHVTYVATANDLRTVQPALRDRFSVVQVPAPRDQDFEILLDNAREDFMITRGIRPTRMPHLTSKDLYALRAWFASNRSARSFADAYETLVSAAIAEFENAAPEPGMLPH